MALYKLVSEQVTVATAGAPVQLSATPKLIAAVAILAPNTNAGFIYVGDENVDSSNGMDIKPEGAMDIEMQNDANGKLIEIDLSQIWIDSATDGNSVKISYLIRN